MQDQATLKRYERSSELVNQASLGNILIIGCGAVGRQLAIQFATMGAKSLTLVDYDIVEEVNLGSQAFLDADLGQPKVEATKSLCNQINGTVTTLAVEKSYDVGDLEGKDAVFCCLDTMTGRTQMWNDLVLMDFQGFYAESRMTAEVVRILTPIAYSISEVYEETLFSDSAALVERCTSRTTIYGATIAASLLASQYAKYLRENLLETDFEFSIHALELMGTNQYDSPSQPAVPAQA